MAINADDVLRAKCAMEALASIKRVGGYPYERVVGSVAVQLYHTVKSQVPVELEEEAQFAILAERMTHQL